MIFLPFSKKIFLNRLFQHVFVSRDLLNRKELEYILSRRKCKIGGERDLRRGVGEVRFGKEDKINRRELGRSAHLYVPLASDNLSSAMHVRVTTVWLETANRELPLAIKGKASGTYRHDAKLPYVSICEWNTRRNTRHSHLQSSFDLSNLLSLCSYRFLESIQFSISQSESTPSRTSSKNFELYPNQFLETNRLEKLFLLSKKLEIQFFSNL